MAQQVSGTVAENFVTGVFLLFSVVVSRVAEFTLWSFLFEQAEQPFGAFPGTWSTWDGSCLQIELGMELCVSGGGGGVRGCEGGSCKAEGRCQ